MKEFANKRSDENFGGMVCNVII